MAINQWAFEMKMKMLKSLQDRTIEPKGVSNPLITQGLCRYRIEPLKPFLRPKTMQIQTVPYLTLVK